MFRTLLRKWRKKNSSRRAASFKKSVPLSVVCGLLWLGTAIFLTQTLLAHVLIPYPAVDNVKKRAALLLFEIILSLPGILLLAKRPGMSEHELALSLGSSAVGIFIVWLIAQVFYWNPPVYSGWRAKSQREEWNQSGFRGQLFNYGSNDFVTILLGDSQVEAKDLNFDKMPERSLEKYLRKYTPAEKVFTIGAQGYGQDQELLTLKDYFSNHRANLVALWETPANDIWNNIFPSHIGIDRGSGIPKPTFWLSGDKLLGPCDQIGDNLSSTTIPLLIAWHRATKPWEFNFRDQAWESKLPASYSPMRGYSGKVNHNWQYLLPPNENLDTEKSHLAMFLMPPSHRMNYGIRLTHRLLVEIEKVCEQNHAKLVVFHWVSPEDLSAPEEEVFDLNGKFYRASRLQSERNMNAINQGFVSCTIKIAVPDWRISADNGHLNIAANDQVMADLAIFLERFVPHDSLQK